MNYYEELIENIENYINNKEYDLAKSVILNELNMPYIPRDIEDKLNEYLLIVKQNTFVKKEISYEEIEEYLNGNEEKQLIGIDELCRKNLREYIDVCDKFLANKDKYVNAKAILIDALIRQEINYEFTYVNNSSLLKFNPYNLVVIENTKDFKKSYEILNEYYMKDPSKFNISLQLLYKEALLCLPNYINGIDTASKIINYVDDAFSAK